MAHPVAVGILAGGASSRMGSNKALLEFRGRPLLERQLGVVRPIFERVLVGANDPAPYAPFGVEVVPDVLAERCALTGIHALLAAARTEHVFVVACDLPFLNPALIEDLLGRRGAMDVVLPVTTRGPEPLHAVYSRACLPAIEGCAREGRWKATAFHDRVKVTEVPLREDDWLLEGRSPFLNVNTPDELRSALG
jgi:molybdopterin-guanine dinucleotide biosynthesis protein A